MELKTERLLLDDFAPPDHLDSEAGALIETFRRWAAEVPRSKYQLALRFGGVLIGTCGVRKESFDAGDAEFGCEIDPRYWRRGFAAEASRAILAFAFDELRVRQIIARTTKGNVGATALAERLGFRRIFADEGDEVTLVRTS
jgi:ribosomal-protein-alanine N-acetyltransferase